MSLKECVVKFVPKDSLVVVNKDGYKSMLATSISIDFVGQKAYGLCCLPKEWTFPFFVISPELFKQYKHAKEREKKGILSSWLPNIKKAAATIDILEQDDIIIRSSGYKEGLNDRGKYYSIQGKFNELSRILKECIKNIIDDKEITDEGIPLIFQKYSQKVCQKGHLSNEKRFSKENRDWVGEYEINPKPFKIALRRWRNDDYENKIEKSISSPLTCEAEIKINEVLKVPAAWIWLNKIRVHYEWVWDGNKIYIVQADLEQKQLGANPVIKKTKKEKRQVELETLSCVNEKLAEKFRKIQNVNTYKKLGLYTADIYVLHNEDEIKRIANGKCSEAFKRDLQKLITEPLVIRMDINSDEKEKYQMLPRKEHRSFDEAFNWLQQKCNKFWREDGDEIIFTFHNFIPASAAAFAYAEPNSRIVHIEALWGLPEGLYYYANDKYTVDTKNIYFDKIQKEKFEINEKLHFKKYFVYPDKNGIWSRQVLDDKYSWVSSINRREWIREIAYVSRQIAEHENEKLSIMWFIDVGKNVCPMSVFPWFHEKYDFIKAQEYTFRPKTVLDKATVIRNNSDVDTLEFLDEEEKKKVKCITIQLDEDESLRDKNFLKRLGGVAKAIGATILLEGGVLSHAYYQLIKTGATVESLYPFEEKRAKREFNKLVRDNIPEMIKDKGESVYISNLNGDELLRALRYKLVEECFEVLDALDPDEILEELADVSEVIDGILSFLKFKKSKLLQKQKQKKEKVGGFEEGVVLRQTNNPLPMKERKEGLLNNEISIEYYTGKPQKKLGAGYKAWIDKREHDDATQFITRILVPYVNEKWQKDISGGSTRALFGDDYIVEINGKRVKAKMQLEVSIYKKKQDGIQLSFLDEND